MKAELREQILAEIERRDKEIKGELEELRLAGKTAKHRARVYTSAIEMAVLPLFLRIQALEREVEELQARPKGLTYRGIHSTTAPYEPGDVTTYDGSMWVCREAVAAGPRPGEGSTVWQLAVKHGRDFR